MQQAAIATMPERQKLAELLRKCSKNLFLDKGKEAHGAVVRKGYGFEMMINNDLIDMYGKCGRIDLACSVFDRMLDRNVVSWTALMCGYLLHGDAKRSLFLFREMTYSYEKPNEFTFSTNFKACGILGFPERGMQIHSLCSKSGYEWYPVVANSIIDMYSRCGRIADAALMFQAMPTRSVISWNVMITGYALEGKGEKSLLLFRSMQKQGEIPDEFTYTSTLKACSGSGALHQGTQIHAFLIVSGFPLQAQKIISGALIDLYVNCGHLAEAHKVFNQVELKSVISWTMLIVGYAQEGKLSLAMNLFRELTESSNPVDEFVLSSMIGVFADFALLDLGKQMHSFSTKIPFGADISVANSIVDMYLKCGLADEAERYFNEMPVKNVVSWTVMITGYGKYGLGNEAIHLFKKMQSSNVEPDGVAYLALLSACSHSGLVEEGQEYFTRLCNNYQLRPRVEHYACMVDILGRAGRLEEAKNLIESMPLKPNIGIWQTLLSACRVHKHVEMGRKVGEILLRLDGDNPVNFVMMSNIFAEARCWEECEKLRQIVKAKGLKKEAGRSWVEIDKEVHFFYNRDESHPLIESIHEMLKEMERRMKEEMGYEYEISFSLHDVEEETQQESLRVHSEKLAIGLALVCGGLEKNGKPIRIFKNLRVCGDCHEFIKGLSKLLQKVFLVRDANRFHKFENGICSCGEYW
ncbi:hypothetical protein M9H77_19218 [Catharanthus roseus]|uniref:Uncharacterized protein n=1 Tax=Catharanthus roseus TaxID=4058 RepID=A0ACC0B9N0_CATRO|nr:hypothetical protein M9H77_19218 [Catharanthus roseus]